MLAAGAGTAWKPNLRGAGEDVGGTWGLSAAGAVLARGSGVKSLSVSVTVWCSPGESEYQRKGFNARHYFCPRFLPANLHFSSLLLPLQLRATLSHAYFFFLVNDVEQIPNVIFSADARKIEEVYYSSVQYSFQRKLLVRSIYLALYTALILT